MIGKRLSLDAVLFSISFLSAIQSENEYGTTAQQHIPGLDEHMQDIIDTLRKNGITKIPTIHNDKNASGQYAMKGLGKVDLCVPLVSSISLNANLESLILIDTDGMGKYNFRWQDRSH